MGSDPNYVGGFRPETSLNGSPPEKRGRRMITAESLTQIPLFACLPKDERKSLAGRAADVRLQQDEWLIVEGQTAAFFALLDGKLSVVKSLGGQDHNLTTFVPGDYFGEVPLLLGTPAVASVRAVEPSRVMRLDPSDFHDLISHCRVLNGEIMKTMALRVNRIQQAAPNTPPLLRRALADATTSPAFRPASSCRAIAWASRGATSTTPTRSTVSRTMASSSPPPTARPH